MNPPKMPIHIGDYKRDTGHLRAAHHGAYLLLLFHYWSTGGLPDDDDQLAAIACMTRAEWRKARQVIAPFFKDGWRHGRVDYELEKAANISKAASEAGKASGRSRSVKRPFNGRSSAVEPTLEPLNHSQDSEAYASAAGAALGPDFEVVDEDPRAKLFRLGKTILVSFGIAEKRTGSLIGQWLKAQNDPLGLLAALQFARDQNVAEPVAYVSAILHGKPKNGASNGNDRRAGESLGDFCRRLAEQARELERAAGVGRPDAGVRSH